MLTRRSRVSLVSTFVRRRRRTSLAIHQVTNREQAETCLQIPRFSAVTMASVKRAAMASNSQTRKKKQKNKKENMSLSDLRVLGDQLLVSRQNINNLPILLEFIGPNFPPQYVLESLLSLQAFFTPLLSELGSSPLSKCADTDSDPEVIYRTWLRSKFDEFMESLISVAVSQSDDALREVVLDSVMDFVKVGNRGRFHSAIYHKLLCAVVHSVLSVDDIILDLLVTKYFVYIDARYFTYISLEKLSRTLEGKANDSNQDACDNSQSCPSKGLSIRMIYHFLSKVPPFGDSDENTKMWSLLGMFNNNGKDEHTDIEYEHSNSEKSKGKVPSAIKLEKKMKLKFSKAWISFLKLELPLDVYKEVLATLHQAVIPFLSNPTLLCDFLTLSYDIGGVISVMALSSLYILMTKHGLEYPNFYNKLYGLLEPSIFMAKHRAKFFQLLDSCLKSSLLPAYLAASFCKKLSRLALFIPPSGALVVIALVHNLLQRHPSIYFLVQQEVGNAITSGTSTEEDVSLKSTNPHGAGNDLLQEKPGMDHFRYEESDPRSTNAMRSSLWELDTLRHHYCPAVSRFVLSLENDLSSKSRAAEIGVNDFCSGSYATIFHDEIRRRVKQVPLAFYNTTPTSLFSKCDFAGWEFQT